MSPSGAGGALGGTLLALALGCALFNLGGVALSDGGFVSVFFAASSSSALLALLLTVNVRRAALFLHDVREFLRDTLHFGDVRDDEARQVREQLHSFSHIALRRQGEVE